MERKAHHSNFNITTRIKKQVQYSFVKELDKKLFILHNDDKMDVFDQFFAYKNVLCKKTGEATYKTSKIFPRSSYSSQLSLHTRRGNKSTFLHVLLKLASSHFILSTPLTQPNPKILPILLTVRSEGLKGVRASLDILFNNVTKFKHPNNSLLCEGLKGVRTSSNLKSYGFQHLHFSPFGCHPKL